MLRYFYYILKLSNGYFLVWASHFFLVDVVVVVHPRLAQKTVDNVGRNGRGCKCNPKKRGEVRSEGRGGGERGGGQLGERGD